MNDWISRWPGKSPVIEKGLYHPAAYHMLDVAAVAERLLAPFGFPGPRKDALIWLVTMHDLGKIGTQFRNMIRDGKKQANGSHWEVTEHHLRHHDATLLAPALGLKDRHRHELYAAVAGHHGRPTDTHDRRSARCGDLILPHCRCHHARKARRRVSQGERIGAHSVRKSDHGGLPNVPATAGTPNFRQQWLSGNRTISGFRNSPGLARHRLRGCGQRVRVFGRARCPVDPWESKSMVREL